MNWKRIARSLVCLLVICALLLNVSPLKARALAWEYALWVTCKVLLASILIGLGVHIGEQVFLPTGEKVLDALSDFVMLNYPFVSDDGRIRVWNTVLAGNSDFPYAVDSSLIELVRSWLFENKVVESVPTELSGVWSSGKFYQYSSTLSGCNFPVYQFLQIIGEKDQFLVTAYDYSGGDYRYFGYYFSDSDILCFGCAEIPSYNSSSLIYDRSVVSVLTSFSSGVYYSYDVCPLGSSYLDWDACLSQSFVEGGYGLRLYRIKRSENASVASGTYDFNHFYNSASEGTFSTHFGLRYILCDWTVSGYELIGTEGVELGEVADLDENLADGYSDWSKNAITVDSDVSGLDDDLVLYPIALGDSLDQTLGYTQEDVWAGNGDALLTPDALAPVLQVDLNTDEVIYEVGSSTRPLIVYAVSSDNGVLSYQWYQVDADGSSDSLIVAGVDSRYSPSSDSVGTFQYYCIITNRAVNGTIAETRSAVATVSIVESGTLSESDSAVDDLAASNATWFSAVIDVIKSIPDAILDGIKAIFVPSEDFLTEKVNIILDEFGFGEAIVRLAQTLTVGFADYGDEPPVVYINLGDARTDYALGGKVAFIDMHWYEEYKPTVDTLLSSFFWLYFIWKMFKQLPGIISGMPGDFVMNTISAVGFGDHLPGRDLGHVITRAENQSDMRTAWKWYQEDDSFADRINIRRGLKK